MGIYILWNTDSQDNFGNVLSTEMKCIVVDVHSLAFGCCCMVASIIFTYSLTD
jgi:hypothetical protein